MSRCPSERCWLGSLAPSSVLVLLGRVGAAWPAARGRACAGSRSVLAPLFSANERGLQAGRCRMKSSGARARWMQVPAAEPSPVCGECCCQHLQPKWMRGTLPMARSPVATKPPVPRDALSTAQDWEQGRARHWQELRHRPPPSSLLLWALLHASNQKATKKKKYGGEGECNQANNWDTETTLPCTVKRVTFILLSFGL